MAFKTENEYDFSGAKYEGPIENGRMSGNGKFSRTSITFNTFNFTREQAVQNIQILFGG